MKINGLDRAEFMVRDLDTELDFFSGALGMEFMELSKEISERDGVRSYVCLDANLHLFSPILPLPPNAAPPMRKRVALLEEQKCVFMALTFLVDDVEHAEAELSRQGITVQHRYLKSHDYASIGMDNFEEIIPSSEDTLGILMGFAKYDRVLPGAGGLSRKIRGLDRVSIMVQDADEAVRFLSGVLGVRFVELDRSAVQMDAARCFVAPEIHVELLSPLLPLREDASDALKNRSAQLKDKGHVFMRVVLEAYDAEGVAAGLKERGAALQEDHRERRECNSGSMENVVQFVSSDKSIAGLPPDSSQYDRV